VNLEKKVNSASFLGEHGRALFGARSAGLGETRASEAVAPPDVIEEMPEVALAEPIEEMLPPPPPAPPPPPPAPVIDLSRLEAAIDRLRMFSDRLAAEARSDALELGLMIARKVVEGELAVNADRLIGVVKSAIGRVGESRRIVVHMAPEDVELLGAKDTGEVPALSRGAAKVEVVPDASLTRGDVLVEGDHLTVDARLDAKFGEIRRALLESAWEEGGE
jgi:hypothetical protein